MSPQFFSSVRARTGQQSVFVAGETGTLWRVVRGVVRLDRQGGDHPLPVWLALPGDLIGIEALCEQPCQFAATALTACELHAVEMPPPHQRGLLLQEALLQQQRRGQDMATLRTGQVGQRVARLLSLMGLPWHGLTAGDLGRADAVRAALPALRDIALVVDAKTETVCRALAHLLPPRSTRGHMATTLPATPWASLRGAAA
jgi:CRP-like cAMP-binding protein